MFRCIFFRKKLASYLEGELSEQERKRVENHLEGCERCRKELSSLKEIRTLLSKKPSPPPFPYSEEQFMASLRDRMRKEERVSLLARVPRFAAVASLVTIFFIIGFLWLTSPHPQPKVEGVGDFTQLTDITIPLEDVISLVDEDTLLTEIDNELADGEAELYQFYLEEISAVSGPQVVVALAGLSESDYEKLVNETADALAKDLFPKMEEGK